MKDIVEFKVLLTCDKKVRIIRMMERDSDDMSSKTHETEIREQSERKRFIDFYGIDIADPESIQSTFNLILDTTKLSLQNVISKTITAIQEYDGFSSEDPKN